MQTSPQQLSAPPWPPRGAKEITTRITPDLPILRGHFPHRLVLPGVAQLAIVCAHAENAYPGASPVAVRRVKYRSPVEPAAEASQQTELSCVLSPTANEGEVEFVLSARMVANAGGTASESRRVAEGVLDFRPQRAVATQRAPLPPQVAPPPQPAMRDLLPHRHPALFVEHALHLGSGSEPSWFTGHVPPDHDMVHHGRASIFAAMEFAAQAAACIETLRTFPTLGARMLDGWLVGVRSATLHAPDFPVTAQLTASLTTVTRGNFVHLATQIAADGILIADADLQIYVQ